METKKYKIWNGSFDLLKEGILRIQDEKVLAPNHDNRYIVADRIKLTKIRAMLLMKGRSVNHLLPNIYAWFPRKTLVIQIKRAMADVSNLIITYNYLDCMQLCTFV